MGSDSSESVEGDLGITAEQLLASIPRHVEASAPKVLANVKSEELETEHKETEAEAEEPSKDAAPGGDAKAEPKEDADAGEPEADAGSDTGDADKALLDELAKRGIGTYKTREAALEGLRTLKVKISQRDEDALIGRRIKATGATPEQIEAWASKDKPGNKTTEEAKPEEAGPFRPPHPFNPAWKSMIREKEEGGYEGPPDEVRKFLEYQAYKESFWDSVGHDPRVLIPTSEIEKLVERKLESERKRMDEERARERSKSATEEFMSKNGEYVAANEEEFFRLVESGNDPDLVIDFLKLKDAKAAAEKAAKTGAKAIQDDIAARTSKTARRAAAADAKPVNGKFDPSKATSRQLLERAMKTVPQEDLPEMLR